MTDDFQDYLTKWFNQHGCHSLWSSAEDWVNSMTNWELAQWIGFYNQYLRENPPVA